MPCAGEHRYESSLVINRTGSKTLDCPQVLLLTRTTAQHSKISQLPSRKKTIQSVFSTPDERNAKKQTRENK